MGLFWVIFFFFSEKTLVLQLFVKMLSEWMWESLWEWGQRVEREWVAEEEKKNTAFRFQQHRKYRYNRNAERYNGVYRVFSIVKLSCLCRLIHYVFYTFLQIIPLSQRLQQQALATVWSLGNRLFYLAGLKKRCYTNNFTAGHRKITYLFCIF